MKKAIFVAFIAWAALAAQQAALPTGASVLDRFVEVTGGKAAYEKHHNEQVSGALILSAQGIRGDMTMYSAEPSKTLVKVTISGVGEIENGTDGTVAWEKSPFQGPRLIEGSELADLLREARFNGPIHWRDMYAKAETIGEEKLGDEDCYKIRLTPKGEGHDETVWFGKKSGLMLKQTGTRSSAMGDVAYENTFSDYRRVGGILMSFKGQEKAAGQDIGTEMKTVNFDIEIPDGTFAVPADIKTLLDRQKPAAAAPQAQAPAAAPTAEPARPGAGGFAIYIGGSPSASETYTLSHNPGGYELSGSGKAQFGPMNVDIEQFRIVTNNQYQPLSATVRAKMGQISISTDTKFDQGMAHSEINMGQGAQPKDDPAGIDDVVISQNLPLFPWTLLARRVSVQTKDPQHFTAYILGQKETPLTVTLKGKESVRFAGREEDLNHLSATLDSLQGTPITADVWIPDDGSRIIKLAVPSQNLEAYQQGYEPLAAAGAASGTSPGAPVQSGSSNPK